MRADKFEMVRYDIHGEIKDDSLSIWGKIVYVFIAALLYPVFIAQMNQGR